MSEATRLALDDPRWAAFVAGHPKALGYHQPAWAGVVASTYRFDAFVLATLDGERIRAGLPVVDVRALRRRRLVALPFTDTCPPLIGEAGDELAFGRALEAARLREGCPLYVRATLDGAAVEPSGAVVHELPLVADPDAVEAGFHHSQRRNIRRAEREGVVVRVGESPADLSRTFYALHAATRHRLGVPVQPRRFFEAQWRSLVEPGHARLLLAHANGVDVAGMLLLFGNGTVTYKFGASDAAAWGVRPNHALFARAIRDACREGNHTFDFGRTDLEDESLRDFKLRFGAHESPLVYSVLGASAAVARTTPPEGGGLRRRVLRRAPAWVGRAAGELLYRYAA
jgi:CelD/BcsL family acetyltransferase involved in cellulose biosynthesis